MRDIVHAVFINLHLVGHLRQRAEPGSQFVLALRHLVVMLLDRQAHLAHRGEHFRAQVAIAIHRRNREVATLHAGAMAHVAFRIVLHRGAGALDAVELVGAEIAAGAELHGIENEELGFRADDEGVTDAGRLQIGFHLLGGRARVARIALAGRGLDDVTDQDQARLGHERVHHRALQVRLQDHVGLVDRLPAGDRGTVEHEPVAQRILVNRGYVLRRVLPLALGIREAQVDIFDAVLLDQIQYFADAIGAFSGLLRHA